MRLTHEQLLAYPGNWGVDGLCHIRLYEQDGRRPAVIAGQLDDNTGTAVSIAIERIAHEITRQILTDGREFELIEHHPPHWLDPATATYSRVEFKHRHTHENPEDPAHIQTTLVLIDTDQTATCHTTTKPGDFRDPSWHPIADIETYLDCPLRIWPRGDYTAANVAGEQGHQIHEQVKTRAKAAAERLCAELQTTIEGPASAA
jgi:hypothetical protein